LQLHRRLLPVADRVGPIAASAALVILLLLQQISSKTRLGFRLCVDGERRIRPIVTVSR
jgi:hypothetical protein